MAYLFLLLAIIFEVIGTTFLKSTQGFSVLLPSLGVVLGYTAAFYFLSLSLQTIPVGIAYAVWAGLGIVLVALISWIVYGQRLDWGAILGMSLIIGGVVVLKIFSKMA